MNSSDETPLPLFERFRDAHISSLIGLMDDVMTSMADLDRSLETAVAISKEFTYLQSIWGAFYDPTRMEQEIEKAEEQQQPAQSDQPDTSTTSFQFEGRMSDIKS
ncbi:hypothetical protein KL930_001648 [Ogataea haglerorum]|uniref:DASH complex subunit DAD1 n=1 Tax=Ogataea haglerorum TaxID=1937702 RepID=A0AAN6D849_9ASCO|nr:uncharacterized protein KL911_001592 [Ogataea haglerorum]KAG7697986.1 hypothetical protein KL915_001703 [Ogataea haglerorum]KAG7699719.1 hypothetical protein KL951_001436 [Ogataea haglerorum]KAG7708209.1 hypothetical protein KL914_001935 [Ogataea haglerorum]KAG7710764.1 hypothetical protein KL950_001677 [Ogataea haglerorum]KAG7721383.1 hypothetical protein KL913_001119 [Ogataea haglerorum]